MVPIDKARHPQSKRSLGLTAKLVVSFLALGTVPLVVMALFSLHSLGQLNQAVTDSYRASSQDTMNTIDRNLFERYGDVQAFGLNQAIASEGDWYKVGSDKNPVALAMNGYVKLYGFYPLTIAVDLNGKVIAANDHDAAGKPIDTAWIYQKNYKDAPWFKEALAGNFLKSATLDGTYVEDVHFNEDVAKATGTDGLSLGFSAPIRNATGKIIGVWSNRATFAFVEEIIQAAHADFKRRNMPSAEFTLLDHEGRIIVDYDPTIKGSIDVVHDREVLLKLNLAEKGVATAQRAIKGESGVDRALHARKKIWQLSGFAPSQGALGFPGLKWSALVRVDVAEAEAAINHARAVAFWVIGISLVALAAVAVWLGRSLSRPIFAALESIREGGESVAATSVEISSASNTLAEGSTEQAASLEETAASIEEMSGTAKANADHAQHARNAAIEARQTAEAGSGRMQAMQVAMTEIQAASQDITKILKTIDEIAFQTNILALNAAVEAARAGEAGMGFAVVAEEVRSLAQRCAAAAKETATKIEDSVNKSQQGATLSAEVAQSFTSIQTQIQTLDHLINDIAKGSIEQNEGTTQVNIAISQVDKVTQSNAAIAEECAASVVELSREAESLTGTVGQLLRLIGGRRANDPAGRGSEPVQGGRRKIDRSVATAAPKATPSRGKSAPSPSRARPMPPTSRKKETVTASAQIDTAGDGFFR